MKDLLIFIALVVMLPIALMVSLANWLTRKFMDWYRDD